jgi:hypothetical protein
VPRDKAEALAIKLLGLAYNRRHWLVS